MTDFFSPFRFIFHKHHGKPSVYCTSMRLSTNTPQHTNVVRLMHISHVTYCGTNSCHWSSLKGFEGGACMDIIVCLLYSTRMIKSNRFGIALR